MSPVPVGSDPVPRPKSQPAAAWPQPVPAAPVVVNVTVNCHCRGACPGVTAADLQAMEARIVSELSDKIADMKAAFDAMQARVAEDVTHLQDLITKAAAGTATPDDFAAMQSITDGLKALDPVPDFPAAPPADGTAPPA